MINSRVLTYGFRLFFGMAVYAFLASFIFAIGYSLDYSDQGLIDSVLGPLTFGWKGGIGSHLGYVVLVGTAAAAAFLGSVLIAFRDADPRAQAEIIHVESVPMTKAPAGAAYTPIVAAAMVIAMLVGLTGEKLLFIGGLIGLILVAVAWMVRAWADRATGDDATNIELYHQMVDPVGVPVVATLVVAFVIISLSRILLATNKVGASLVFGGAAVVFMAIATVIAIGPKLSKNVLTVVLAIGGLLILALGVVGIAVGERDFEKHEGEGHSSGEATEAGAGEGALGAPADTSIIVTPAGR